MFYRYAIACRGHDNIHCPVFFFFTCIATATANCYSVSWGESDAPCLALNWSSHQRRRHSNFVTQRVVPWPCLVDFVHFHGRICFIGIIRGLIRYLGQ